MDRTRQGAGRLGDDPAKPPGDMVLVSVATRSPRAACWHVVASQVLYSSPAIAVTRVFVVQDGLAVVLDERSRTERSKQGLSLSPSACGSTY